MEGFIHQIISGIATGGIYASVALALVMIYQATHHVNFAQGEMATFSTYIALVLINFGLPYWVAFIGAFAISFVVGVIIERLLMRPVMNAPVLTSVGVFVGLLLIVNSVMGWFFDYTIKQFPSPFPDKSLAGGYVSGHELGSTAVTLAVLILVYLFFRHTRLGLAMRAAAFNPASSRLVGVRVGWMLALGWGLAAAIGSVAGCMVAPVVFLDPNMMSGILLYAFVAGWHRLPPRRRARRLHGGCDRESGRRLRRGDGAETDPRADHHHYRADLETLRPHGSQSV